MRVVPALTVLLVVLSGCLGALGEPRPEGSPSQDGGQVEASGSSILNGTVEVEAEQPLDLSGPWRLGTYRVHVLPGSSEEVVLTGPLRVVVDDGVVDRVDVLAPNGLRLAHAACHEGACQVRSPLGAHDVPAASIAITGNWHEGRPTGFVLEAARGEVSLRAQLFGPGGVQLSGDAIGEPVTVAIPLVLEGDPRDPDRVELRTPGGERVLAVEPSGREPARLTVGDQRVAVDEVHARLVGDPLTDPEVRLTVVADEEAQTFIVYRTLSPEFEAAQQAGEDVVILRSPTRLQAGELTLEAGPAQIEGSGELSPRFPVRVRLATPASAGYERATLLVDGAPRVTLELSGSSGDQRVFHGRAPPGGLVAGHDREASTTVRLERDLAPGLVQRQHTEPATIRSDARGPAAPDAQATEHGFAWSPVADAARYEAQARPEGGSFEPVPVDGTQAQTPTAPAGPWEGRVRAVDAQGNPGPWSQTASWTVAEDATRPSGVPTLQIEWPEPGATVDGVVPVRWTPDAAIAQVHLEVSPDQGDEWIQIGTAGEPPIRWDSRNVPDGRYLVRLTADGAKGTDTRTVNDIHVDNLDPVAQPRAQSGPFRPASGGPDTPGPSTSSPLPAAAATLLGVLVVAGGVRGLRSLGKRRDK